MVNQHIHAHSQANLGMFGRRTGRVAFLLGVIYWIVIISLPALLQLGVHYVLSSSNSGTASPNTLTTTLNILSLLFGIAGMILLIPVLISCYIRRLHDVNESGWLTLLICIPLVNLLLFLYLLFAPGTKGNNKYGSPVNSYNFFVVTGLKKP